MQCWYMSEGIANIILMHKLEQLHRITYHSWDEYYVVHHQKGPFTSKQTIKVCLILT